MAASKKTLDTNFLNLRTIFAYNPDNTNISSTKVLATDGQGGTFWSPSQLLGQLPTFNAFQAGTQVIRATNTNGTLRLTASNGLVFKGSTLIGEYFTQFDVSGSRPISTIKKNRATGVFNIQTSGFISAYTDKNTNTVTLSSSKSAPALSTGDLYFQQLKVVSSVQEPCDATGNSIIYGASYDTYPSFVAVSPLTFSTLITTKQVYLSAYPYTAAGFLSLSSYTGSLFISSFSTISTVYVTKPDFSTGMESVSTIQYLNYSTNMSTVVKLSNDTQIEYLNAVGNTLARAFVVQVTDQFTTLNTGLTTLNTNKTLKSFMFNTNASFFLTTGSQTTSTISTFTDFANGTTYNAIINRLNLFSTQLSTLSTSLGLNVFLMSNLGNVDIGSYILSTNSTFSQLGSIAYLSSLSLVSTVKSLPYISSQAFQSTIQSLNFISSVALFSTFSLQNQLDLYTDRSTFIQTLQSTTKQINENAPYVSSLTFKLSLQSTVEGIPFILENYIETVNLISTSRGIINYAGFNGYVSTLSTLTTKQYVSSKTLDYSLYSTTNAIFSQTSTISTLSLRSTVNGLGQLYLSSIKVSSFGVVTTATVENFGNKSTDENAYYYPEYANNPNSDGVIFYPPEGDYYYIFPDINPYYDYGPFASYYMNTDIFFTSDQIYLNELTNFIKNTSRVQIDFNLNIYIDPIYDFTDPYFPERLLPMTSYLTYGTVPTTIPEAQTTEHVYYKNTDTPAIKITKRISFTIAGVYLTSLSPTTLITLRHRIQNFTYNYEGNGGQDGKYLLFPSLQNSVFVSIYN